MTEADRYAERLEDARARGPHLRRAVYAQARVHARAETYGGPNKIMLHFHDSSMLRIPEKY